MENRDNQKDTTGSSGSGQDKSSATQGGQSTQGSQTTQGSQSDSQKQGLDQTSQNQSGGFKQPQSGSQQDLQSAGETTTLGQQDTDIEGQSQDSSFVGKKGSSDSSSSLVEEGQDYEKDGQGSTEA